MRSLARTYFLKILAAALRRFSGTTFFLNFEIDLEALARGANIDSFVAKYCSK